ncbi:hypothetical protein [Silvibacterium sp.]|uniref:hypothetical protein n=1 Tax=Silvibacterium sp. TaxID=1964179 RepID=UPI0039E43832
MQSLRNLCAVTAIAACAAAAHAQTSLQALSEHAQAQVQDLSKAVAASLQSGQSSDEHTQAVALDAMLAAWHETADGADYAAVQAAVDADLQQNAATVPSRALLECLLVTGESRYSAALEHASAGNDPVYQARHAAAWKQPALAAPSGQPGATPEGARLLEEIADSYAATPAAEWKDSATANDNAAWKQAAARAAAPWLHKNAGQQDAEVSLTASYGISKAVRLGLLPAGDAQRAAALYEAATNTQTPAAKAAQLLAAS